LKLSKKNEIKNEIKRICVVHCVHFSGFACLFAVFLLAAVVFEWK
jgi:hypothetical protein